MADNGLGMIQETIDIMHNKVISEQTWIGNRCEECKRTDPADLRRGVWSDDHSEPMKERQRPLRSQKMEETDDAR